MDRGVNYFDVAPSYGDAEEKLGLSLKPHRKDLFLACKTTIRTKKEAEKEFEESLRLLHTDYFDVFQLHSLTTPEDVDKAFDSNGVIEMIEKEKSAVELEKWDSLLIHKPKLYVLCRSITLIQLCFL